jgi:hypothetical protein
VNRLPELQTRPVNSTKGVWTKISCLHYLELYSV